MSLLYPPHRDRDPQMHYPFTFAASSSWWVSPSGLSLTAFPADTPLSSSSSMPYCYPPPRAFPQPSSSRTVFGANSSHAPASPTDSLASSSDSAYSPTPAHVHAVCTAPLVAPKPLPYHSPTFLQFDLPDDDEDLSHPPYVSRPHKRKRTPDDAEDGKSGDGERDAPRRVVVMRRRADDRPHAGARWPGAGTYMAARAVHAHTHSHTQRAPPASVGLGQYAQRHR